MIVQQKQSTKPTAAGGLVHRGSVSSSEPLTANIKPLAIPAQASGTGVGHTSHPHAAVPSARSTPTASIRPMAIGTVASSSAAAAASSQTRMAAVLPTTATITVSADEVVSAVGEVQVEVIQTPGEPVQSHLISSAGSNIAAPATALVSPRIEGSDGTTEIVPEAPAPTTSVVSPSATETQVVTPTVKRKRDELDTHSSSDSTSAIPKKVRMVSEDSQTNRQLTATNALPSNVAVVSASTVVSREGQSEETTVLEKSTVMPPSQTASAEDKHLIETDVPIASHSGAETIPEVADINDQTEETQETALTLACCDGVLEVADLLIKGGTDIEIGSSIPLMEAAQEGHLELVRYLINAGASMNENMPTNDTALTYACENSHTDVGDLLLQAGAELKYTECLICFEDNSVDNMIKSFCGHPICVDCLRQYSRVKIEEGADEIQCPSFNCSALIDENFLLCHTDEIREMYGRNIVKEYVRHNPLYVKCSDGDCEFILKKEKTSITCGTCICESKTCFSCKGADHEPIRCNLLRSWRLLIQEFIEKGGVMPHGIQKCPQCMCYLQKMGGCNHIKCPSCLHEYCWICSNPWKSHSQRVCEDSLEKMKKETNFVHFYQKYTCQLEAIQLEKGLKAIVNTSIGMPWLVQQHLNTALGILIECRTTLSIFYVFSYFLARSSMENNLEVFENQLITGVEKLRAKFNINIEECDEDTAVQILDTAVVCKSRRLLISERIKKGIKDMCDWDYTAM